MYDVEIKDVSVYYGSVCALQNVDLKIRNKEFLGIIGPNGGGKSTLLKVLLRLIKPTTGSISIKGSEPIGYVPQFAFFDRSFPINVLDVILMGKLQKKIRWFKKYSAEDISHAENIMEKLGILEFRDRQIKQLSGGQLQKVLIARALITDPRILVLDEPTSSLDIKTKKEIYHMLNKLREEKTIMIVTHEMEDILPHMDNIVYVNRTLKYYKEDLKPDHGVVEKMCGFPNKDITKGGIIHRELASHREVRYD